MAKKKVNKRYDYESEARDEVIYERSRIQRKMNFLILRGAGFDTKATVEENADVRKLATLQHFKVKFVQCKTDLEIVVQLKDANVWAGGVVLFLGEIEDSQEIQKTIKKILIPVEKIKSDEVTSADYLQALKKLLQASPKK